MEIVGTRLGKNMIAALPAAQVDLAPKIYAFAKQQKANVKAVFLIVPVCVEVKR
jgi:hypothetical protein